LAPDSGSDTNSYAAYQTLASRAYPYDSLWPIHMAYQQGTAPGHRDIFFERWKTLMTTPTFDAVVNISQALEGCDNIHPSLAINGTVEPGVWWGLFGKAKLFHDNLAWESELTSPFYLPVVRARHVVDSPFYFVLGWGAFDVFNAGSSMYQYPQISAESRTYDGRFAFPTDSSHDWVRMAFGGIGFIQMECWSPNWLYYRLNEGGFYPTVPQTTNDPVTWPDSGSPPRSISWVDNSTGETPVRVTNGYMPRITHTFRPNVLLEPSIHPCDTTVFVGPKNLTIRPPSGPPVLVNWDPVNLSSGDAAESWENPEIVPNVAHTDAFAIQACDSILIPRTTDTNGLAEIQDSLKSGSDYVMFRMKLLRKSDSAWIGTIDSMIVTKTVKYWAGAFFGINPTMARYEVPCTASPDSAFVSMEVLREDTTNSIHRYYVNLVDTITPFPAAKEPDGTQSAPTDGLVVTVHPNPASSSVKVCVEDLPQGIPVAVNVVNQIGVSVATLYNATPDAELGLCLSLDCSHLPSGIYYADLQTEGMHHAVKFVVEH
jgi:hypothetical protein